jgi:hypothetical protein
VAEPLEIQLGLLAIAQAPKEASQPRTAGRADLFAEDDDGREPEEQLMRS